MNAFTQKMARVVTVLINCMLVAGGIAFLAIPKIADAIAESFVHRVPTLICMYAGGIAAYWLIYEFRVIMDSVQKGTPFVTRNVQALKHIAICCGWAAADIIFILFFTFSVPLVLCAFVLTFGMLCAIVLASVFRQAVEYKQETDLTI